MADLLTVAHFQIHAGYLDRAAQHALLDPLRAVLRVAPLLSPVTPGGQPMSVRMTAAGRFGWLSDAGGYRYADHHPNGRPWPAIPDAILSIWRDLVPWARAPECCLINLYGPGARMGLHQDSDEADMTQPVVSVSLGCDARFRMGQAARTSPTQSIWLTSGDVVVMAGPARHAFHGVDRIRPGSSTLLPGDQRLNLTLRVVT